MAKYPTTEMCNGTVLEAFEPTTRTTDVFCATAAKSGQTWLMSLMHHLRTRGLDPEMGKGDRMAVMPWLEMPKDMSSGELYECDARIAQLEALPDPRVFKMHVLWDEIPRAADSGARVVTITRDPRDLPYSMFQHRRGMKNSSVGDDFNAFFDGWMEFGYFFKFVHSFWPHYRDADVLWLRYEDLQADRAREAHRLVEFLGWELSEEDIQRALPLVDFKRMQDVEMADRASGQGSRLWKQDARFFREGGVGKNRAHLSGEQERRIVERARDEFEPACFDFVMSQGT